MFSPMTNMRSSYTASNVKEYIKYIYDHFTIWTEVTMSMSCQSLL